MCKFKITVELCGCRSPNCTQRPNALDQSKSELLARDGGHIYRVITCYRQGPLCIKTFYNEDPHRLLVYYGMDPDNRNSTQDCSNKSFVIDPESKRLPFLCNECRTHCRQPAWRAPTEAEIWDVDIEAIPVEKVFEHCRGRR